MKTFKMKLFNVLFGAFLAAALLCALIARGHTQTIAGQRLIPTVYCQLTSIDASVLLSSCAGGIPTNSVYAFITAEAQAIRYRDDGTAPTATVGQPLAVGVQLLYGGTLSALQVISQTSGAKLNVLFYR